jgi:hypothetical protein
MSRFFIKYTFHQLPLRRGYSLNLQCGLRDKWVLNVDGKILREETVLRSRVALEEDSWILKGRRVRVWTGSCSSVQGPEGGCCEHGNVLSGSLASYK